MKLVVLLSGGIDSTVLVASRLSCGDEVLAVSFDYGQTHIRELESAKSVAGYYGVDHEIITLPAVLAGRSVSDGDSVVPGRNLVMLSIAAAIGETRGAVSVVFGANADDQQGFPDCRPGFITAVDEAVYQSSKRLHIDAPFGFKTKRDIIQLGRLLEVPFDLTWSCYQGGDQPCTECGACLIRDEAMK